MDTQEKKNLIQEEIDFEAKFARPALAVAQTITSLLGGIICLGMLCSIDDVMHNQDDRLKALSAVLWIGWSLIRIKNQKISAQNKMIYNALQANEETQLEPKKEYEIIKNKGTTGIICGTVNLSIFAPIIAHGMGYMSAGVAGAACAGIYLSTEIYARNHFKRNNKILKQELPSDILLPDLRLKKERE